METTIDKQIDIYINDYLISNDNNSIIKLSDWLCKNYNQCNDIEKSVGLLLSFIGVQKNNASCMFNCGYAILSENNSFGISLIEKAASLNYGKALKFLANYYTFDDQKALYYWQQCLNCDDIDKGEVYENLGSLYFSIDNSDYKKGFEYLIIAADKYNMPYAKFRVASAYFYGEGIEQNTERAFQYCFESASLGCDSAQFWLGKDYYISDEFKLETDLEKAKYYLTLAYNQGNARAAYFLGLMYYFGEGVNKDYYTALNYFKNAKDEEIWQACAFLGQIYFEQENYFLARIELEKSFLENDILINGSTLAQIYKDGLQCEKDISKAIKCYEILIENKEASELDISYVADCYFYGNGVPQNLEKAAKYYDLIEYSNAYAKYQLGCIALDPTSSISSNRCILYFEGAGAKGYTAAYQKLGDYFESINNMDRAFDYYVKCFELGDAESAYKAGKVCETGTAARQKNLAEAVNWYKKASEKGCEKATEKLKHFKSTLFGYRRI